MVAIMRGVQGSYIIPTGSDTPRTLADLSALSQVLGSQRTMAIVGDSISVGYGTQSNDTFLATWSWPGIFQVLSGQRFYYPQANEFAVSGRTAVTMAANIADVVAVQPDICFVLGGTNDINGGATAATVIAALETIYTTLLEAGIVVVAIPILGRTWSTDTMRNYATQVNNWIRTKGSVTRGLLVADCGLVYDDPTSTTFDARSGYNTDGLHPGPIGAHAIASRVKTIVGTIFPDWIVPLGNAFDTYSATENPYGNLLGGSEGMFIGTGGTAAGSVTGNVATGWTITDASAGGATVAASKSTLADGRVCQVVQISGNYSGNTRFVQISNAITPANIASGDELETFAYIEIDGSNSQIRAIRLRQATVEGGTQYNMDCGRGYGGYSIPTGGYSGIFRTPRRTMTAAPSAASVQILIDLMDAAGSTAVAATVRITSVAPRKVQTI